MGTVASQITCLTIVYSTVYSDADQRKHQSSGFVRGIHRGPLNSPHKWPVTRKMFPFDDVIMKQAAHICAWWKSDLWNKHNELLFKRPIICNAVVDVLWSSLVPWYLLNFICNILQIMLNNAHCIFISLPCISIAMNVYGAFYELPLSIWYFR